MPSQFTCAPLIRLPVEGCRLPQPELLSACIAGILPHTLLARFHEPLPLSGVEKRGANGASK